MGSEMCIRDSGTTNFILTKMIEDGMQFDDALKLAQELGFAERNPAADIEGHDACRKICILASLAYGKHVYPDSVHTEGITMQQNIRWLRMALMYKVCGGRRFGRKMLVICV